MTLWGKVRLLGATMHGEITALYQDQNIPIEVRDNYSEWIESSIYHFSPEQFAAGLSAQIQESVAELLNSKSNSGILTTPFYIIQRLTHFQALLAPTNPLTAQDLQTRFLLCLEKEKALVERNEAVSALNLPTATSSALPPFTSSFSPRKRTSTDTAKEKSMVGSINQDLQLSSGNAALPASSGQHDKNCTIPLKEAFDPATFLNNAFRIIIDGEMDKVFKSVWDLEKCNNTFTMTCLELKRHIGVKNQHLNNVTHNGAIQNTDWFNELLKYIADKAKEVAHLASYLYQKATEVKQTAGIVWSNWMSIRLDLTSDLSRWSQEQKWFANGKPMTMDLEKCRFISCYLMRTAWNLRNYLQKVDKVCRTLVEAQIRSGTQLDPKIHEILEPVIAEIKKLPQDTFLVTHQPNQVLKNNTGIHPLPGRSPMEVQLLVGEQLGLQVSPPSVSAIVIDEKTSRSIEAEGLQESSFKTVKGKGRIFPDIKRLGFSTETKCPTAIFDQVTLRDIQRKNGKVAKNKEESLVTDEKFCILFRSEFSVDGLSFQVWRKSLPIVVIKHSSQEKFAWATVTWDNAFSLPTRVPFEVPKSASLSTWSEVLNYKFMSMVGSPLTDENLKYFDTKLSSFPGYPSKLTWADLCRKNLPGRDFTFWDWFYEGAKIIEEHFKKIWTQPFVKGFCAQEACEELLCNSGCSKKTFLFRLSDSTCGGISIVWLDPDGNAYSATPFTRKELAIEPLAEKIRSQKVLTYCYPDIPKEKAMKAAYDDHATTTKKKNCEEETSKYVKFQLVGDNSIAPKFRVVCTAEQEKTKSETRVEQPSPLSSRHSVSDESQPEPTGPVSIAIDINELIDDHLLFCGSPNGSLTGSSDFSELFALTNGDDFGMEVEATEPHQDVEALEYMQL